MRAKVFTCKIVSVPERYARDDEKGDGDHSEVDVDEVRPTRIRVGEALDCIGTEEVTDAEIRKKPE